MGDRYSTDRYSADRYSTDRYSTNRYSVERSTKRDTSTDRYTSSRYSVERSSRADNNTSDRYVRDRISRDRYSTERYLSPKPRSRYSSRERDYYSGSSRYEDKRASPSPEDKEKTNDLLSEIKYMKADIEIRIEQADDLVIDEKAASEKIKKESSKTDVPDAKTSVATTATLESKDMQRPSSVERGDPYQTLVY